VKEKWRMWWRMELLEKWRKWWRSGIDGEVEKVLKKWS